MSIIAVLSLYVGKPLLGKAIAMPNTCSYNKYKPHFIFKKKIKKFRGKKSDSTAVLLLFSKKIEHTFDFFTSEVNFSVLFSVLLV